ncbi:RNA polymerase sigma factor [Clostridium thermobutyricum]|uniref:RNA polymerase sigma factor SigV n=1 Tax=Clostridium thermobutyricum DSM 4928 TaxID=1121339 RepID=A0A1V4SZE2_9CLOT|nr:sigma-70 family RNA polymerase sigma factor [Clostridium thermobutyricum]OPX49761.1 RNA polymerase sigma factor SigV [Clostridium thermobutyricum DSM 4928]
MGPRLGVIYSSENIITKEELAIKGDKEAFVYLINEHRLSLYRIAKGILKDDYKVEDAISNTIIKAFENIKKLKKAEYFKTWLIRILINECNLTLKKEKRILYLEDSVKEEAYIDLYENIDLINAIETLDDDLKLVTILYYFEDIDQKEIAKIISVKESTVRTKLFRARKKLYEILK